MRYPGRSWTERSTSGILKAGLPIETPAVTVNVVCGSGLNCVNMAAQMIQAGDADIVVAGGMENMSMAPYALPKLVLDTE